MVTMVEASFAELPKTAKTQVARELTILITLFSPISRAASLSIIGASEKQFNDLPIFINIISTFIEKHYTKPTVKTDRQESRARVTVEMFRSALKNPKISRPEARAEYTKFRAAMLSKIRDTVISENDDKSYYHIVFLPKFMQFLGLVEITVLAALKQMKELFATTRIVIYTRIGTSVCDREPRDFFRPLLFLRYFFSGALKAGSRCAIQKFAH